MERRLRERGQCPRWIGEPPAGFTGITADSRETGPGALFCALRGSSHDGHDFLNEAVDAGAAAALVEQHRPTADLPQLIVPDSRAALAHLASLVSEDPAAGLMLVGITGTNGKTTTALITRHLMASTAPSGAIGTLGRVDTNGGIHAGRLTTPDPFDLMAALALLRDEGALFAALEVSSHALDQRRVESLEFAAAVFTNLSHEHLDYHADIPSYRSAKLRLAALVPPDGVCLINDDDPAWKDADYLGRRVVRYGLSPGAEVRAADIRHAPTGSDWMLETADGRWPVSLPLLGDFNVLNALAAASVATELGVAPADVARRLGSVPQVPGRLEILAGAPSVVLRDYMHTPDAYRRVLPALRGLADGRLIIVFGCGGDRDRRKRPIMGRIASDLADLAIVTMDNPRSEDPAAICREITADLPPASYRIVLDREKAIGVALSAAEPGDVVLLAGKGHETYQEIAGERIPFDESAIVGSLTGESS